MTIEALDAMVTGYLTEAGFNPETLTMSQLEADDITLFNPQMLNESPGVQEGSDPAAEGADPGSGDAAAGAADAGAADAGDAEAEADAGDAEAGADAGDAAGGEAPEEGEAASGGSLYSYSVNVTASGGWKEFYKLIDKIATVDGVEVTNYAYTEGSGGESKNGSFSMTVKFYVFVEGVIAETESGEPAA
jgi:hypothetical protein